MVEVAAGILVRAREVLACQRRATDAHPGKWEFPGGKRDAAETLEQCLQRELAEELGIEAVIGPRIWRNRHVYPAIEVDLSFYLVSRFHGPIDNRNFASLAWVRVGELSSLDFLDADRPLVEQIDSGALVLSEKRG